MHGVVNRHAGGHASTRAVDVEMDVGFFVLVGQNEKLGDDHIGDIVVNGRPKNDDPVLKQAGVNVHRPFFAAVSFDDDWNQSHL